MACDSELKREEMGGKEWARTWPLHVTGIWTRFDGECPFWALFEGSSSPSTLSLFRYVFVWLQM